MLHTNYQSQAKTPALPRFTHVTQRCVTGIAWGEHRLKARWHSWALSGGRPFTICVHPCGRKLSLCLVDHCQCIPEAGLFLRFCFCVRCAFILFHISSALQKRASVQKEMGLEVPHSTKHTTRARRNHRFKQ